jgi:hypothetical protein
MPRQKSCVVNKMGTMTVLDKNGGKPLSPAAKRALAEAEARRQQIDAEMAKRPKEKGGRGGLDPARYGDWEIKGITSDF